MRDGRQVGRDCMTSASIRAHRFSVLCAVAALVWLGWSPLQASAAVGATAAVGSTGDASLDPIDAVSDTATGAVDAVSAATTSSVEEVSTTASSTVETVSNTTATSPVDTVSNTVSSTVDPVSNTISSTVDPISNTASGTVNTVANTASGTVDPISNTASGTVNTVSNTIDAAAAAVKGATGDTQASAGLAVQSSTVTGMTSPTRFSSGQQAAATGRSPLLRPQSLQDDLVLLAERSRTESAIGDKGHGSCVAAPNAACQARMDGDAGSWTRSVADIIRKLLALTGSGVLSWVFAAGFLALAGMASLNQARDRSELGSARPS